MHVNDKPHEQSKRGAHCTTSFCGWYTVSECHDTVETEAMGHTILTGHEILFYDLESPKHRGDGGEVDWLRDMSDEKPSNDADGPLSPAPLLAEATKYAKSAYDEFNNYCYLAARDGFHDGARYALKQIESGKAAVTIASEPKPKKRTT